MEGGGGRTEMKEDKGEMRGQSEEGEGEEGEGERGSG